MGDLLKDKVAIVTGAARGIGKGIALLMAEEGAKVVVNDLGGAVDGSGGEKVPADEVVDEIKAKGGTAVANYDSVASYEDAENIIKTAIDSFGKLDILVNNAGILRDRMVFNMSYEEWDAVLQVHLYGVYNCTRHACPIMRNQKSGRIINFSSSSGLGNLGQANYSAAKEAIVGFTRTVARDMGKYGVTCNAIRPGAATRMTITPELKAAMERKAAAGVGGPSAGLGQIGALPPEDIAPFVVWLASDESANVNGYDFQLRGGDIGLYSQPIISKTIFKTGRWTVDELKEVVPKTLAVGLVNPSPLAPPK
ncbi:MAG: SDR family oxidoreductase [Thermodesulfobacteriota bacterium]|nr:SDR family oxidoreductase [Thermodesulfobacteriota bacterium]